MPNLPLVLLRGMTHDIRLECVFLISETVKILSENSWVRIESSYQADISQILSISSLKEIPL